jgi:hypothetical protein
MESCYVCILQPFLRAKDLARLSDLATVISILRRSVSVWGALLATWRTELTPIGRRPARFDPNRGSRRANNASLGAIADQASNYNCYVLTRMCRQATVLPEYACTPTKPGARPRSPSVLWNDVVCRRSPVWVFVRNTE